MIDPEVEELREELKAAKETVKDLTVELLRTRGEYIECLKELRLLDQNHEITISGTGLPR